MRQSKIIHRSEFETSQYHKHITDTSITEGKDLMYSEHYSVINGKKHKSITRVSIGNPYDRLNFNTLSVNLYQYNEETNRTKEMSFDLSTIEQAKALMEVLQTFIDYKTAQ